MLRLPLVGLTSTPLGDIPEGGLFYIADDEAELALAMIVADHGEHHRYVPLSGTRAFRVRRSEMRKGERGLVLPVRGEQLRLDVFEARPLSPIRAQPGDLVATHEGPMLVDVGATHEPTGLRLSDGGLRTYQADYAFASWRLTFVDNGREHVLVERAPESVAR